MSDKSCASRGASAANHIGVCSDKPFIQLLLQLLSRQLRHTKLLEIKIEGRGGLKEVGGRAGLRAQPSDKSDQGSTTLTPLLYPSSPTTVLRAQRVADPKPLRLNILAVDATPSLPSVPAPRLLPPDSPRHRHWPGAPRNAAFLLVVPEHADRRLHAATIERYFDVLARQQVD